MAYITLTELKDHLDITGNDQDALLNRCIAGATMLINGFLGADLSDPTVDRPFTTVIDSSRNSLRLPAFPIISVESVVLNGEAVPESQGWWVDQTHGFIEDLPVNGHRGYGGRSGTRASIIYRAGWQVLPSQIRDVALSLAAALYRNGGEFPGGGAGGTGELKSMTMFDAMSMTFDVGSGAADSGTPEGMVSAWAFALKPFQVSGPGMA